METLKKGSKGESVKKLQQLLNVTPVDGIFGNITDAAVRKFQTSKGLYPDGIVGPKTWKALGVSDEVQVQKVRTITHIFVHCTASSQNMTPKALLNFFFNTKKWKAPGYHYVIEADGTITNIWPEEKISNGVKNMNSHSINISWIGGVTKEYPNGIDNRTQAQKESLIKLLKELRKKYPKAKIMGHRDTSPDLNGNGIIDPWERIKSCPCFDAMIEYKDI